MKQHSGTVRSRGRPRSISVDNALVQAALEEFKAHGFHAMSMEAIAARAGVSKVSLYRRWRSKLAVTADLLELMSDTTVPQDRGSLRADILWLFRESIGSNAAKSKAKVLMRTMGELTSDPELLTLYRTHLMAPRIQQIRAVVDRARKRKELRTTLPLVVIVAMIAGPLFLYYLAVLTEADVKLPRNLARLLANSILSGIGAD